MQLCVKRKNHAVHSLYIYIARTFYLNCFRLDCFMSPPIGCLSPIRCCFHGCCRAISDDLLLCPGAGINSAEERHVSTNWICNFIMFYICMSFSVSIVNVFFTRVGFISSILFCIAIWVCNLRCIEEFNEIWMRRIWETFSAFVKSTEYFVE